MKKIYTKTVKRSGVTVKCYRYVMSKRHNEYVKQLQSEGLF